MIRNEKDFFCMLLYGDIFGGMPGNDRPGETPENS
jgi:hypothetical protein